LRLLKKLAHELLMQSVKEDRGDDTSKDDE